MKTLIWAVVLTAAALSFRPEALVAQGAEIRVEVALETRFFPQEPLFAGQRSVRFSPSMRFSPEFVYEWKDGLWRFTAVGFVRIDAHDSRRTHADLRELGLLYLGDRVTVFAGVGKVFWGVTEARHLVDIVNQTDAVEDIDSEDKLGQPMVNVTLEGGWGYFDVFYLPMSRERTYPAAAARLRGPFPISSRASYESGAGRFHQDFALRWARPFGSFDLGAAFFRGTSREPRFIVVPDAGSGPYLRPHYDLIDQFGVDVQWTGSAALLKFEAITRGGHGKRFFAATGGIEYTLYQLLGGSSDIGLLAEFMLDGRGAGAPPTVFDNDLFLGFRWALNDMHDSAILGGPVIDYTTGEIIALLEAERRLGGGWRFELEARLFANTASDAATSGLRRDGFATLRLSKFF